MRVVLASGGSRGLDRSWPRPSLLPSAMAQPFARDATLLPGLGSCHGSIRQEEKRGCSASASEGNVYLPKVLIHGARAAVLRMKRDRAPIGAWLDALDARAPKNVVVVAMANKLARIAWAVLSSGEEYKPASNLVKAS